MGHAKGALYAAETVSALTTYTWDGENRLSAIAFGGNLHTMTYDADGLRRSFGVAADVTRFVWDNQDVLLETNAGGVTQTSARETEGFDIPRGVGYTQGGEWVGQPRRCEPARKVRTPQGRALAKGQAGKPDGKWHRNIPPGAALSRKHGAGGASQKDVAAAFEPR